MHVSALCIHGAPGRCNTESFRSQTWVCVKLGEPHTHTKQHNMWLIPFCFLSKPQQRGSTEHTQLPPRSLGCHWPAADSPGQLDWRWQSISWNSLGLVQREPEGTHIPVLGFFILGVCFLKIGWFKGSRPSYVDTCTFRPRSKHDIRARISHLTL